MARWDDRETQASAIVARAEAWANRLRGRGTNCFQRLRAGTQRDRLIGNVEVKRRE